VTVAVGDICVTPATVEGLAGALLVALLDTAAGGGVVVVTGTDVTGTGSDASEIVELPAAAVLFCVMGMTVGGSDESDGGGVVIPTGGVVVVPLPILLTGTEVSTGGVLVGESVGDEISVTLETGGVTIPVGLVTGGVVIVGPSVVVSVAFPVGGTITLVGSTGGVVLVVTSVDSVALVTGGGTIATEDGLVGSGVKEADMDGEDVSTGAVVSTMVEVSTGDVGTTEGEEGSIEDMGTEEEGEDSVRVPEGEEGSIEEVVSTTEEEDPITGIPVPDGILVKEKEIPMSVGDGAGVPVDEGSSVGTITDPESVEVGVVSVPFCEGATADAMLLTTELMSPRMSVVVVAVGSGVGSSVVEVTMPVGARRMPLELVVSAIGASVVVSALDVWAVSTESEETVGTSVVVPLTAAAEIVGSVGMGVAEVSSVVVVGSTIVDGIPPVDATASLVVSASVELGASVEVTDSVVVVGAESSVRVDVSVAAVVVEGSVDKTLEKMLEMTLRRFGGAVLSELDKLIPVVGSAGVLVGVASGLFGLASWLVVGELMEGADDTMVDGSTTIVLAMIMVVTSDSDCAFDALDRSEVTKSVVESEELEGV
jgi:hypothetical protein